MKNLCWTTSFNLHHYPAAADLYNPHRFGHGDGLSPRPMTYFVSLKITGIIVGLLVALAHLPLALAPERWTPMLRRLPRNYPLGVVLMLAATIWFTALTGMMDLGEISSIRAQLMAVWAISGLLLTIFVPGFLAARGFGCLLLHGAADTVALRAHPAGLLVGHCGNDPRLQSALRPRCDPVHHGLAAACEVFCVAWSGLWRAGHRARDFCLSVVMPITDGIDNDYNDQEDGFPLVPLIIPIIKIII
jgi:hypothetical protein